MTAPDTALLKHLSEHKVPFVSARNPGARPTPPHLTDLCIWSALSPKCDMDLPPPLQPHHSFTPCPHTLLNYHNVLSAWSLTSFPPISTVGTISLQSTLAMARTSSVFFNAPTPTEEGSQTVRRHHQTFLAPPLGNLLWWKMTGFSPGIYLPRSSPGDFEWTTLKTSTLKFKLPFLSSGNSRPSAGSVSFRMIFHHPRKINSKRDLESGQEKCQRSGINPEMRTDFSKVVSDACPPPAIGTWGVFTRL